MENLHLAPDNEEDDLYSGYDYQDNLLDVSDGFLKQGVLFNAHHNKQAQIMYRWTSRVVLYCF